MLHACVTLLTIYCLLFEPINARFDSRPPFVKPIIAYSDLPVKPITRLYCLSYRIRILKSCISRLINRFADRSDLRPFINKPIITYSNLRPYRIRISQSRIFRLTYLFTFISSVSSLLISVSISVFALTSFINLNRYLYCGNKLCVKR
jgi:hypothetical protein